ncbi:MAG TPA: DNA repair protein RadC [Saprospiraceae bacterium]|nr:DNA repair protein RadC [Saprospiraceae bacterium]HRX29259.1 DNA repair protein RadC [Saprospiraceae bacterium]
MDKKQPNTSIKSWSLEDRPREKLLEKGRSVLTDSELLAILIGSGIPGESAVDLSRKMLQTVDNSLNNLGKLSIKELTKFKGIGEARAIVIAAALELGRRRQVSEAEDIESIKSSKDIFDIMSPYLSDLQVEEFWVLLLNKSNKIIKKELISKGGVSATVVDIKLIFKSAIDNLASSIVLLHNHPSGNIKPSKEDIRLTQKVKEACEFMDVNLLDHIIIANKNYLSFIDEGLV